jgi:hypothetical protein
MLDYMPLHPAPFHYMLNYMLNYMLHYMPLHPASSHYMFHYMITTCSITCFITYSTTYHYMHCMALNFLSPWSRASCAAFHTQGAPLLKRCWYSRSSLSAAMIDEGLAREDPPQPPWTWKHRARVSKDNQSSTFHSLVDKPGPDQGQKRESPG